MMAAQTSNIPANATLGTPAAAVTWENPVYADAGNTTLNVIYHHPSLGPIPFTVDPKDKGAPFDAGALWNAVKASGVAIAAYVAPV